MRKIFKGGAVLRRLFSFIRTGCNHHKKSSRENARDLLFFCAQKISRMQIF